MSYEEQREMCRQCPAKASCTAKDDLEGNTIENCCFGKHEPSCDKLGQLCEVVPLCRSCSGATNGAVAMEVEIPDTSRL